MEGTYTTFFITKYQVPRYLLKYVTYGRIVVDYIPQKEEPHILQLTVGGGGLIVFSGYFITPTEEITTAKIIINSTISTPGARYMCCDTKD